MYKIVDMKLTACSKANLHASVNTSNMCCIISFSKSLLSLGLCPRPLARDGCGLGGVGVAIPHIPHTCPSCPLDRVIHHTKSAFGGKPEFSLPHAPPSSFPSWHFEKRMMAQHTCECIDPYCSLMWTWQTVIRAANWWFVWPLHVSAGISPR